MDRIDIRLTLKRVTATQMRLTDDGPRLTSAVARARVIEARAAARERLAGTAWTMNGQVSGPWLRDRKHSLGRAATASLDRALERGGITMRGYDRTLRLAWTVADIEGLNRPAAEQIGAALYLRKGMTP